MKQVQIVIDANGEVKIEAKGFTGTECLAATKDIEAALGKVEARTAKPEQFINATVGSTVKGGK